MLAVFDSLSIIVVKRHSESPVDFDILVDFYGRMEEPWLAESKGIIWVAKEFHNKSWFSVVIKTDEVDSFLENARIERYDIVTNVEVDQPWRWGDTGSFANICHHPRGWIVLPE